MKIKLMIMMNSPIANFIYGCIWFSIGLLYWQTQLLTDLGLGYIGLFITGFHLLVGFILISSNYDYIIYSSVRHQYKKDMLELEQDKIQFKKMMNESKNRTKEVS